MNKVETCIKEHKMMASGGGRGYFLQSNSNYAVNIISLTNILHYLYNSLTQSVIMLKHPLVIRTGYRRTIILNLTHNRD